MALREGEFRRARALVEAGADPNARIKPLPAPAWWILSNQLLHRSSATENKGITAFMGVCGATLVTSYGDDPPVVEFDLRHDSLNDPDLFQLAQVMIAHGADVNARDERGNTALMEASLNGLNDRVALLFAKNAAIDAQNNQGRTALHHAISTERLETIKLLLKAHANLRKDQNGWTPLKWASSSNIPSASKAEIIRLLKVAGATE